MKSESDYVNYVKWAYSIHKYMHFSFMYITTAYPGKNGLRIIRGYKAP